MGETAGPKRRHILAWGVGLGTTGLGASSTHAAASEKFAPAMIAPDIATLASINGKVDAVAQTLSYDARYPQVGGGARYILTAQNTDVRRRPWQHPSATPGLLWQLAEARPDPAMLGAQGDAQSDDTSALQAGLDYLASTFGGGELFLAPRRYRTNSLLLPKGTGILGRNEGFSTHYPETLSASTYTLLLTPGATITMQEATTLHGLVLHPHGMTFPQDADAVSRWSGTAIDIAPESGGVHIGRCMIAGFAQAIMAAGAAPIYRTRIEDLSIDCLNGISLSNVPDVAYLSRVHAWNFASTGRGALNALARPGVAFRLAQRADWAKLTDCFCYGYEIGFELLDVADCTLTGCGADHKPRRPGEASSTGFKLHGRARNNRLIGCQAAAHGRGIHMATKPDEPALTNHIQGGVIWDNGIGLDISSGYAMVSDLAVRVRGKVEIGPDAAGGRLNGLLFEAIAAPQIDGNNVAIKRFLGDQPVVIS